MCLGFLRSKSVEGCEGLKKYLFPGLALVFVHADLELSLCRLPLCTSTPQTPLPVLGTALTGVDTLTCIGPGSSGLVSVYSVSCPLQTSMREYLPYSVMFIAGLHWWTRLLGPAFLRCLHHP